MYGDSQTLKKSAKRKREAMDFEGIPGVPDITAPYEDIVNFSAEYESHMGDSYFAKLRARRQANKANKPSKPNVELNPTSEPVSGRYVELRFSFERFSEKKTLIGIILLQDRCM